MEEAPALNLDGVFLLGSMLFIFSAVGFTIYRVDRLGRFIDYTDGLFDTPAVNQSTSKCCGDTLTRATCTPNLDALHTRFDKYFGVWGWFSTALWWISGVLYMVMMGMWLRPTEKGDLRTNALQKTVFLALFCINLFFVIALVALAYGTYVMTTFGHDGTVAMWNDAQCNGITTNPADELLRWSVAYFILAALHAIAYCIVSFISYMSLKNTNGAMSGEALALLPRTTVHDVSFASCAVSSNTRQRPVAGSLQM